MQKMKHYQSIVSLYNVYQQLIVIFIIIIIDCITMLRLLHGISSQWNVAATTMPQQWELSALLWSLTQLAHLNWLQTSFVCMKCSFNIYTGRVTRMLYLCLSS